MMLVDRVDAFLTPQDNDHGKGEPSPRYGSVAWIETKTEKEGNERMISAELEIQQGEEEVGSPEKAAEGLPRLSVSVKEFAGQHGISEDLVYKMIRTKKFPYRIQRFGRLIRITEEEVVQNG